MRGATWCLGIISIISLIGLSNAVIDLNRDAISFPLPDTYAESTTDKSMHGPLFHEFDGAEYFFGNRRQKSSSSPLYRGGMEFSKDFIAVWSGVFEDYEATWTFETTGTAVVYIGDDPLQVASTPLYSVTADTGTFVVSTQSAQTVYVVFLFCEQTALNLVVLNSDGTYASPPDGTHWSVTYLSRSAPTSPGVCTWTTGVNVDEVLTYTDSVTVTESAISNSADHPYNPGYLALFSLTSQTLEVLEEIAGPIPQPSDDTIGPRFLSWIKTITPFQQQKAVWDFVVTTNTLKKLDDLTQDLAFSGTSNFRYGAKMSETRVVFTADDENGVSFVYEMNPNNGRGGVADFGLDSNSTVVQSRGFLKGSEDPYFLVQISGDCEGWRLTNSGQDQQWISPPCSEDTEAIPIEGWASDGNKVFYVDETVSVDGSTTYRVVSASKVNEAISICSNSTAKPGFYAESSSYGVAYVSDGVLYACSNAGTVTVLSQPEEGYPTDLISRDWNSHYYQGMLTGLIGLSLNDVFVDASTLWAKTSNSTLHVITPSQDYNCGIAAEEILWVADEHILFLSAEQELWYMLFDSCATGSAENILVKNEAFGTSPSTVYAYPLFFGDDALFFVYVEDSTASVLRLPWDGSGVVEVVFLAENAYTASTFAYGPQPIFMNGYVSNDIWFFLVNYDTFDGAANVAVLYQYFATTDGHVTVTPQTDTGNTYCITTDPRFAFRLYNEYSYDAVLSESIAIPLNTQVGDSCEDASFGDPLKLVIVESDFVCNLSGYDSSHSASVASDTISYYFDTRGYPLTYGEDVTNAASCTWDILPDAMAPDANLFIRFTELDLNPSDELLLQWKNDAGDSVWNTTTCSTSDCVNNGWFTVGAGMWPTVQFLVSAGGTRGGKGFKMQYYLAPKIVHVTPNEIVRNSETEITASVQFMQEFQTLCRIIHHEANVTIYATRSSLVDDTIECEFPADPNLAEIEDVYLQISNTDGDVWHPDVFVGNTPNKIHLRSNHCSGTSYSSSSVYGIVVDKNQPPYTSTGDSYCAWFWSVDESVEIAISATVNFGEQSCEDLSVTVLWEIEVGVLDYYMLCASGEATPSLSEELLLTHTVTDSPTASEPCNEQHCFFKIAENSRSQSFVWVVYNEVGDAGSGNNFILEYFTAPVVLSLATGIAASSPSYVSTPVTISGSNFGKIGPYDLFCLLESDAVEADVNFATEVEGTDAVVCNVGKASELNVFFDDDEHPGRFDIRIGIYAYISAYQSLTLQSDFTMESPTDFGTGTFEDGDGEYEPIRTIAYELFGCEAGSFSTSVIQSCQDCSIGTFSLESSTTCTTCDPGTFSDSISATTCTACSAGTYVANQGQTECISCPVGFYQDSDGMSSCIQCAQTACDTFDGGCDTQALGIRTLAYTTLADDGSTIGANSFDLCICDAGYYAETTTVSHSGRDCQTCPDSAVCEGDASGKLPLPVAGYYAAIEGDPASFLECDSPGCPGVVDPQCGLSLETVTDATLASDGSQWCCEGYQGYMCSSCVAGYYLLEDSCYECPETNSAATMILLILAGLVFSSAITAGAAARAPLATPMGQMFSAFTGSISIGISFSQITAIFPSYDLSWPDFVTDFLNNLTFFNLNLEIAKPECQFTNVKYTDIWLGTMLIPVVGAALFALFALLGYLYLHYFAGDTYKGVDLKKRRYTREVRGGYDIRDKLASLTVGNTSKSGGDRGDDDDGGSVESAYSDSMGSGSDEGSVVSGDDDTMTLKESFTVSRKEKYLLSVQNAFVLFLMVVYLMLATKSLEPFDCSTADTLDSVTGEKISQRRMDADPDVICDMDDGDYAYLVPSAILATIFYVIGIPATLFAILYRNRRLLQNDRLFYRYGFVYEKYEPQYYYWEFLVMMRKLSLALAETFFSSIPLFQSVVALLVLMVSLIAHTSYQPFNDRLHDRLEFLLLVNNILVMFLGLIFMTDKFPENDTDTYETIFGVFAIVLVSTGMLCLMVVVAYTWYRVIKLRANPPVSLMPNFERLERNLNTLNQNGGQPVSKFIEESVTEEARAHALYYLLRLSHTDHQSFDAVRDFVDYVQHAVAVDEGDRPPIDEEEADDKDEVLNPLDQIMLLKTYRHTLANVEWRQIEGRRKRTRKRQNQKRTIIGMSLKSLRRDGSQTASPR